MRVLAGDIGGTHTRLALFELDAGATMVADYTARSREVSTLSGTIEQFLASHPPRPTRACIGLAGPVRDGHVTGTNLPWSVSASELADRLRIPTLSLINDFAAAGHGIAGLRPRDFLTLQAGEPEPGGPLALIGSGTGLGVAYLIREGGGYAVHASEGGHATFAPEDARGRAFHAYLAERYSHVSWERVVSGQGLVDAFEFLARSRSEVPQDGLREAMAAGDAAAVIAAHGMLESNPLAAEALELFVESWGAAAGNLALTVLASGGVYLIGAVARQLVPKLAQGGFLAAFQRKGRLRGWLERIPVQVILNADVGLLGAARVAAGEGLRTPAA